MNRSLTIEHDIEDTDQLVLSNYDKPNFKADTPMGQLAFRSVDRDKAKFENQGQFLQVQNDDSPKGLSSNASSASITSIKRVPIVRNHQKGSLSVDLASNKPNKRSNST
jgi:hypothetical protein